MAITAELTVTGHQPTIGACRLEGPSLRTRLAPFQVALGDHETIVITAVTVRGPGQDYFTLV